jgi:hypothetical protein
VKKIIAAATLVIVALVTPARAQEQKPLQSVPTSTLKVQLVLSRYQGDKKVSSLPYTLTVNVPDASVRNAVGRANLRMGTQVPVTTMARQSGDINAPLVPTVQYRDIGTNIDCNVMAFEDGRFRLELTVEDSAVDSTSANSSHPAFRSFRTNGTTMLRDGQSAQFSTATDKVSSEVWKVDVTLTVVK